MMTRLRPELTRLRSVPGDHRNELLAFDQDPPGPILIVGIFRCFGVDGVCCGTSGVREAVWKMPRLRSR